MTDIPGFHWLPLVAAPFVGSFLGTVVVRHADVRGLLTGRSMCPACRRKLGGRDLVPVASWVALGGRCRYCAAPIGWFYPAIELTAIAVAVWAILAVPSVMVWPASALGWLLIALAWIDARERVLPDGIVFAVIVLGLATTGFVAPGQLVAHGVGVIAGFVAFAAIAWTYARLRGRTGLGFGDAKLLAAAGAWVSWQGLPSVVLIAAATALAVASIQALAGRSVDRFTALAFGPYLCVGLWLVWLYGPLEWSS